MARVRIIHKLNPAATRQLLSSGSGGLAKNMLKRGHRVASFAKKFAPVRTGRLRSSVNVVLISVNGYPGVAVGTNVKYAKFVHDGRRAFRAKPGKVLVFKAKGRGNKMVFTKKVKATKPNPFLKDALIFARLPGRTGKK